MKQYQNQTLQNIVFPIGGLGAGSIGLSGIGQLVDCEIMHTPNRETHFRYTHFAVKAEDEEGVLDWRVLIGDNTRDYIGTIQDKFGQGNAAPLAGFPNFRDVRFSGQFPFAKVNFADNRFPGRVQLEAYNPFIPSNDKDSSLPAAFFTVKVKNTTEKPLKYSVAFSVSNPFKTHGAHVLRQCSTYTGITMHSGEQDQRNPEYGNMTLATTEAEGLSYQQNWFRGGWADTLTSFVNDFSACGPLKNRVYEPVEHLYSDTATLSLCKALAPGESAEFPFLLTWFVPNIDLTIGEEKLTGLKSYYSTLFDSADEVCGYCVRYGKSLYRDTKRFAKALYASSLPAEVLEAINGNLAILKSTTCLRLENGEFWAWEGVNRHTGSCPGTCQHVWNYVYTLPFLFPKLEKGVRSYEYDYSMQDSGLMIFRTRPNFDGEGWERPCVDGQMGSVMQAYRDWKISGDTSWLRTYWPKIKKALTYAWSPENRDRWDPEQQGIITGRQHHTLDMELFGVNSWLTGFYHGALLAAHEMALELEDPDAEMYLRLYQKGRKLLDALTFRDGFYVQAVDLKDKSILDGYASDVPAMYWNSETEEIKYQIKGGCEIDQVVADWHGELMGLPPIFDQTHRKQALESIYRYNFKSMREICNTWRVFACHDEKGLLICSWPHGDKPRIPVPYESECMTGFEYAAACNMLQCGMEKEALEIVRAVRQRYDGAKRNPWAELECGASYSRAMACYAFLLTYSGFQYHMARNRIGFTPIRSGRYFWSLDGAWGTVDIREDRVELDVAYGKLHLRQFVTDLKQVTGVTVGSRQVDFRFHAEEKTVELDVELNASSRVHTITLQG